MGRKNVMYGIVFLYIIKVVLVPLGTLALVSVLQLRMQYSGFTRSCYGIPPSTSRQPKATCYSLTVGQNLRWCCVSPEEYLKCLSLQFFVVNKLTPLDGEEEYDKITCVKASDTEGCMQKIRDNEVDALTLNADGIYTYGKEGIIRPILAENYDEGFSVKYYAVAVVKKTSDFSFLNMKGKRSCHNAIAKTAGWVAPIGRLIEMGLVTPDVYCDVPKAVSQFFSGSCAPAAQMKKYNSRLSGVTKLCSQCHGDEEGAYKCVRDDRELYYSYKGAFRCLVEDQGDVAFIKHSTVVDYTNGNSQEAWAAALNVDDFELLCMDGSRAPINQFASCHVTKKPAHAVVIRSLMSEKNVSETIRVLNATQRKFGENSKTFQLFKSSSFGGSDLLFKDNTKHLQTITLNYTDYLGRDFIAATKAIHCEDNLRWCVISAQENAKCRDMSEAFVDQQWKPEVECISGANHAECFNKFNNSLADVMTLDGGDAYQAGKDLGMIPVASEHYGLEHGAKYYAVVVVKRTSSLRWPELKGVRSCHTGLNKTSGWIVPTGSLVESGQIKLNTNCDVSKAVGDYFSSSCAPGANDKTYNPYSSNKDKLCQQCIGDENGDDKCSRGQHERYYGYDGAFRCLVEGSGDVAFVKHATVLENTDGHGTLDWNNDLSSSDYMLLCLDGTTAEVSQYLDCNLAKAPAHLLMVTKQWQNQTEQVFQLMDAAVNLFKSPENASIFSLFSSDIYKSHNLLFIDNTDNFEKLPKGTNYLEAIGENYLKALTAFTCKSKVPGDSSMSNSIQASSIILALSVSFCLKLTL